jgi:hypothetical protein
MKQYVSLEIRVELLVALFIFLAVPVFFYYADAIIKRMILKANGFKLVKNELVFGTPKNVQWRYVKEDKFIRVKKVDNMSSIKLWKWIKKNK